MKKKKTLARERRPPESIALSGGATSEENTEINRRRTMNIISARPQGLVRSKRPFRIDRHCAAVPKCLEDCLFFL